tara:strand:+ start:221 stop:859 length:639 start_codon:yes stop_codon:yes gene_type:complete
MPVFNMIRPASRYAVLVLILFAIGACAGLPGSAPTRFYILKTAEDIKPGEATINLPEAMTIGIGPVQIPGYADRPQIVTFDSGAEINVSDFDHWAEPLSDAIKRVVSSNVASLIGEEKVFAYPADFRPNKDSVQVALDIIDITETGTGVARLSVRWHLKELYDNTVLARHAKTYEMPATTGDYNSYANALSTLLGQLSRDIANSLDGLNLSS